ncbi:MAG: ATP-binding cassette domain-containing protein [Firmicutes bacterium]|nr:ATP-binding cassette domain-containing protein [Bacillota bacterium]
MKTFIQGQIYKTYWDTNTTVFYGADIEIKSGEIYIVAGRNSVGKSTLLRILSLSEPGDQNTLTFQIDEKDISFMPTNLNYYPYMKISDLLQFHQSLNKRFNLAFAKEKIFEFDIRRNIKIKNLSEGKKKILSYIMCLSIDAKLYILDEPFPYVDLIYDENFRKMIINLYDEDKTFIIATHQINEFEKVASQCLIVKNREIIESYDIEKIRTDEEISLEEFVKERMRL